MGVLNICHRPGYVCSCEILDFSAVNCDLFNDREVSFSIKLLCEMNYEL